MVEAVENQVDVEIVRVISGCRLLDTHSEEHIYWRRNGVGLAPGYYVTRRGGPAARHTFNEDAEFRGPFRSREEAQIAMVTLVARIAARGRERTNVLHC